MHLYTPLLCAKFQGNWIWSLRFMAGFVRLRKDGKKEEKKKKGKTKKLSQFLKSHISGTVETISCIFGMWSTEVGGRVHSKKILVLIRQHKAMEVQKSHFLSSCQYTHGCCMPASWATRHTTVCLDIVGGGLPLSAGCNLFMLQTKVSRYATVDIAQLITLKLITN